MRAADARQAGASSCGRARRTSATTCTGRWRSRAGPPASTRAWSPVTQDTSRAIADRPVRQARGRPAGAGQARGQRGREPALCLSGLPAGAQWCRTAWCRSASGARSAIRTTAFFDRELHRRDGARRRSKDPFEYRRALLADKPRHRTVLETGGAGGGMGQAAAGRHRPRHRAARLVRLDRRAGRRGRGRAARRSG